LQRDFSVDASCHHVQSPRHSFAFLSASQQRLRAHVQHRLNGQVGAPSVARLARALQKMVEFANKVNGNLYTEQNTSGQLWIAGRALGIGTGEVSSAVRSAMSTA
jgi:hypothetical protein